MEIGKNRYVEEINGKKVYLKKDMFGFRVINPNKDEQGKWIVPNLLFGGYRNLVSIVIIIVLLLFVYWMFNSQIHVYKEFYENFTAHRTEFCTSFQEKSVKVVYDFNSSKITFVNITT